MPTFQECQPLNGSFDDLKNAEAHRRRGFVRNLFAVLAVQLLATTATAALFQLRCLYWLKDHSWALVLSLTVTLATLCAMKCCCSNVIRKFPTNFFLLCVLTLCEGVLVGLFSVLSTWKGLPLVVGTTAIIFIGMTVLALTTTGDFAAMGVYFFSALMTFGAFGSMLGILNVAGVDMNNWWLMAADGSAVAIYVVYVIFDTQLILGARGGHKMQFGVDDHMFAAISLHLDMMNPVLRGLAFLGDRERSDRKCML